MKWLVCGLNDEDYAYAKYEFASSLEKAREICIENIMSYFDISRDEITECLEEHNFDADENNRLYGIKISFQCYEEFYVNHIIPVDIKEEDFVCVWHHAYDGVEFCVRNIGTHEECKKMMYQEVDKIMSEINCSCDYDIGEQVVLDTGTEWEVWDIIQYK